MWWCRGTELGLTSVWGEVGLGVTERLLMVRLRLMVDLVECVVWQSKDGSWALGCHEGEGDDVFFLEFAWVSVGHGTVGGAVASFGGPLPGSGSFPIAYEAGSYEQCDGYDEQVKRFLDPVYAADQDAAFMRGVLSGRWFIGGETSAR